MDVHARIDAAQSAAKFLGAAGPRFDCMPALRALLEGVAAACSTDLTSLAGHPVLLTVASVETMRGAAAGTPANGSVAASFASEPWGDAMLVALDRDCVWLLTDAMFGGDGTEALPPDPPACSRVEMQVAKSAAEALVRALETAFDPAGKADFRFDRLDVVTDKLRDRMGGMVARFAAELFGRSAALSICIPPSLFPALKRALPLPATNEARADPAWALLMEEGVKQAEVTLRAFLEERLTLGVIARLKVGQILPLQSTPRTRARAECNGQPLFWCEIGQGEGTYTIRIDEPVDQTRESGHAVPHH